MQRAMFREGTIWRVPMASWQEYRDHLLRLSPRARQSRFGGAVSDSFIEEHARKAMRQGTEIHGWYLDGVMRGALELCPLGPLAAGRAEAAFSVEDDHQARGVGSALFARLLRLARTRRLTKLIVVCLPSNTRMQAIAAKFGGRIGWQDGDVIALIDAPAPTAISWWREAVEETQGFLAVMAARAWPRLPAASLPQRASESSASSR